MLLEKGAVCALRGAGSKSYGNGRIDIHAVWQGHFWYFQLKNWKTKIPKTHMETLNLLHASMKASGVPMDKVKLCFGTRTGFKLWELYTFPDMEQMVIK